MKDFIKFFILMNVLIIIAFWLTCILVILCHFLGLIFGTVLGLWLTFGCSYLIFKVLEKSE
jgi:hypothetical protein